MNDRQDDLPEDTGETERKIKKALEMCIKKSGKEHKKAASHYSKYGLFLVSLGEYDKAKVYLNKAYRIIKKNYGEENLYTARCLCHISNLNYYRMEFDSAFKNMNKAYLLFRKIKGDDDKETKICKNNCGKVMVMLKQYDEAVNYLTDPFAVISGKEGLFLLLDYTNEFMTAPEIFISKKGASVKKFLKIAENKNIPIVENHVLARGMMKDCEQFEPVIPKYYDRLAKIVAKIKKKRA